jgi:hypothetical protein
MVPQHLQAAGMARAQFHKNQRVFVRPVGTWAQVERVIPQWTKGLEEPLRINYDVGLGREFAPEELESEPEVASTSEDEHWRVVRAPNKWQSVSETSAHPHPGTHPIVMTGDLEWGGWRVPGAEYALSPARVEKQARLIATAPRLAAIARKLVEWSAKPATANPQAYSELMREAREAIAALDNEAP